MVRSEALRSLTRREGGEDEYPYIQSTGVAFAYYCLRIKFFFRTINYRLRPTLFVADV